MRGVLTDWRLDLKDVGTACVDHLGFATLANALEIIAVALVDMAVRHQLRRIFVDEIQEGFKAAVSEVFVVA